MICSPIIVTSKLKYNRLINNSQTVERRNWALPIKPFHRQKGRSRIRSRIKKSTRICNDKTSGLLHLRMQQKKMNGRTRALPPKIKLVLFILVNFNFLRILPSSAVFSVTTSQYRILRATTY